MLGGIYGDSAVIRLGDPRILSYPAGVPQISGSDGFTTGLPGICADCFKQTRDPHPPYYYCEHNQRLVVWRAGFWETFRGVEPEQLSTFLESAIAPN